MVRLTKGSISTGGLLWLALAACGGDDGGSSYQGSCERECARAHLCSSTVDPAQCTATCEGNLASIGPHLSSDYLQAIDRCAAALSCNQLVAAGLTGSCADQAKASLAPSAAATAFCGRVASSYQQCLGTTVSGSDCLNNSKMFSDTALNIAAQCDSQPCNQRVACLKAALGVNPAGN